MFGEGLSDGFDLTENDKHNPEGKGILVTKETGNAKTEMRKELLKSYINRETSMSRL